MPKPKLSVGTSGYAYKEWKGSFYPDDLPAKQMLRHYGERFTSVEINASFYRLPTRATLEGWAAETPAGFTFAFKSPQQITHFKRLKGAEEALREFVDVTGTMRARLGPLLFGLPPNMKKDAARLGDFLALLPKGTRAAFEFRHASWFDDEVYALLKERDAALCIADTEDIETPLVSTAGWGYVRLRKAKYTGPRLKEWARHVTAQRWSEAFVYFMHEETGTGPKFGKKFIELAAG